MIKKILLNFFIIPADIVNREANAYILLSITVAQGVWVFSRNLTHMIHRNEEMVDFFIAFFTVLLRGRGGLKDANNF